MKDKMSSVEVLYGPGAQYDALEGKQLCAGEHIVFEYPDGTVRKGTVHNDVKVDEFCEPNGFRWTERDCQAYVTCKVHGMSVRVYIRGLKAVRLNDGS